MVLDSGIFALMGALLGGRVAYVLLNWEYYSSRLWEAIQIQRGGLTWFGALLGGILFLSAYARRTRQSFELLSDRLLPLLGCLAIGSWLGCLQSGCAYGMLTDRWWGLSIPDEWGRAALRVPVQLFGAVLTLGLLWGLERRRLDQAPSGSRAVLGVIGVAGIIALLSYFRADPAPLWWQLRLDLWASLLIIIPSAAILIFLYQKR